MAVEDIRISLQLLSETVDHLEKQIAEKETARAQEAKAVPQKFQPQIDMFGNWTGQPVNDRTNAILAKKLDNTIDRIQNLLREGAV